MRYEEAKDLFNAMNFSLSKEDTMAIESAEEALSNIAIVEAFVDSSKIKEATNKALETSKKVIEKIKVAFHKLVIKFGLIIRSIQHRAQERKIRNAMQDLGDMNLVVPNNFIDLLRKTYEEAGIQNSWDVSFDRASFQEKHIPLAVVRKELKPLVSKAKETDAELENYINNPDPSIDTKALRSNAQKCSAAINLTIKLLNTYVFAKHADATVRNAQEKFKKKNGGAEK